MDDIPNSASCPVPESTEKRIMRPIVTVSRGTFSSCPDAMREALPVVGEDSWQNAPTVWDSCGHPVQCLKLTESNRQNCNLAWLSKRDNDEGMRIVILWGATR
jgi:hypothetical protein